MSDGRRDFVRRLPGRVAVGLCILVTTWWTAFMLGELFFEGWYGPFEWLFFLLPPGACLALTLAAIIWPRVGGWLLIVVGGGLFAAWIWRYQVTLGFALTAGELALLFAVSGALALVGILFLFEDRRRRREVAAPSVLPWWRRNMAYLLAVGIPVLVGIAVSIEPIVRISGRVDDGDRGARLVVGNEVALTWAPAGPGWGDGRSMVNWNQIALYGLEPVGFDGKRDGHGGRCREGDDSGCATTADMERHNVCRYLDEAGTGLMPAPVDHWRMPTTDELVRSLVRHGGNAGCEWNGELGPQPCDVRPDKETPLWDPTAPAVGYWAAQGFDAASAYQVGYNGSVVHVRKIRGENFGYRCVRTSGSG